MSVQRVWIIILACLLLLSSAGLAEEDPVVVRVNQVTYPLSVVQFALDPYLDMAAVNGEEVTEEKYRELRDRVISHFVDLGVIENKLMESGNNDFTEDEMDILRAEASGQFEQIWQQLYRSTQSQDPSVTEEEVTSWMTSKGYTKEAFLRELMVSERESRILDMYCSDVSVTEEEVQTYYQENFLEPDREKYEFNVPLYEKEIILTGAEAFFVPEGYRYLKNILLPFPDAVKQDLEAMKVEGNRLVAEVQAAYDRLAEAAAGGEEIGPFKEAYDRKVTALRTFEEQYLQKEREAIPLLQDRIDLIREQLAAGISIDAILKEYSLDQQQTGSDKPGMLYHTASETWRQDMREAVDAMTRVGELSRAFADDEGVHLMYYAGDAPGGERRLNAEEQAQLRESALYAARIGKLSGLIAEWTPAYEVWTDASLPGNP